MICQYAEQRKEAEIEAMQCHFCPSVKGIVKRVVFNAAETIWLHPECYTWPYPIVYQKNIRRIHFNSEYPNRPTGKFWVNFEHQKEALCQICNDSRGLKIKCMYYTCEKYYHCSCAKTIGVIRDLQSMRFDNCETYIPPYCQEHLEKRIADCAFKARKYKGLKDEVKASHFSQMAASYAVQHKNLLNSARKYQQQQKIRKQMEYQMGQNQDIMEDLSFEEDASRAKSHHPHEFYQFVFDAEYPKRLQPTRRTSILQAHPSRMELEPPVSPQANVEQQPEITATINFLKTFSQNRAGKYERDSEPEESEWHSSPDFDEEDD